MRVSAGLLPRILCLFLGVVLLAVGSTAVFVTPNSTGTSLLIAAGTITLALGLLADRLQSIEGAGVKLQLGAIEKLEEARVADAAGDQENAEKLRDQARLLLAAASPLASKYERIRLLEPSGWDRTRQLESVFQDAKKIGSTEQIGATAAEAVFDSGTEGNRVFALGVMAGSARALSPKAVRVAVEEPRSAFEQYQALLLADNIMRGAPSEDTARSLADAARRALQHRGLEARSSDRGQLARSVIEQASKDHR